MGFFFLSLMKRSEMIGHLTNYVNDGLFCLFLLPDRYVDTNVTSFQGVKNNILKSLLKMTSDLIECN